MGVKLTAGMNQIAEISGIFMGWKGTFQWILFSLVTCRIHPQGNIYMVKAPKMFLLFSVIIWLEKGHCRTPFQHSTEVKCSYVQGDSGKFVASFIQQFETAEFISLSKRTSDVGDHARCCCLVVQLPDSDTVIGTADLVPSASHSGHHPRGVPEVWPLFLL